MSIMTRREWLLTIVAVLLAINALSQCWRRDDDADHHRGGRG
jgi:hypothetical protein